VFAGPSMQALASWRRFATPSGTSPRRLPSPRTPLDSHGSRLLARTPRLTHTSCLRAPLVRTRSHVLASTQRSSARTCSYCRRVATCGKRRSPGTVVSKVVVRGGVCGVAALLWFMCGWQTRPACLTSVMQSFPLIPLADPFSSVSCIAAL
jgi:hypothetical protein